jgi:hypothetical protein
VRLSRVPTALRYSRPGFYVNNLVSPTESVFGCCYHECSRAIGCQGPDDNPTAGSCDLLNVNSRIVYHE